MTRAGASATLRTAVAGSRLVGLLRSITSTDALPSGSRGVDPAIERDEIDAVRALLAESRIGRAAVSSLHAGARAWSGAGTRHVVDRLAHSVAALTVAQRIRAAGVWLAVAAIVDAAATSIDPRPISGYRWMLWAVVLALGLFAAAEGEAVAIAWDDWRAGRTR